MPRRHCADPKRSLSDTRVALTIAMKRLAESRGLSVDDYSGPIRLLRDLRNEADQWLVLFVRDAIERGDSWADVGQMLGVSRQSAHERYAPLIVSMAQRAVDRADRPEPP